MTVELQYEPPLGKLGATVHRRRRHGAHGTVIDFAYDAAKLAV